MSLNTLKPVSMLVKFSASTLLVLNGVLLKVSRLKSPNINMCLFSADKIKICISKSSKKKEHLCWEVYRLKIMIYYFDYLSLFSISTVTLLISELNMI